jgi:hypothetical protein
LFAMYVKVVFGKLGLVCWHNPPFVDCGIRLIGLPAPFR